MVLSALALAALLTCIRGQSLYFSTVGLVLNEPFVLSWDFENISDTRPPWKVALVEEETNTGYLFIRTYDAVGILSDVVTALPAGNRYLEVADSNGHIWNNHDPVEDITGHLYVYPDESLLDGDQAVESGGSTVIGPGVTAGSVEPATTEASKVTERVTTTASSIPTTLSTTPTSIVGTSTSRHSEDYDETDTILNPTPGTSVIIGSYPGSTAPGVRGATLAGIIFASLFTCTVLSIGIYYTYRRRKRHLSAGELSDDQTSDYLPPRSRSPTTTSSSSKSPHDESHSEGLSRAASWKAFISRFSSIRRTSASSPDGGVSPQDENEAKARPDSSTLPTMQDGLPDRSTWFRDGHAVHELSAEYPVDCIEKMPDHEELITKT